MKKWMIISGAIVTVFLIIFLYSQPLGERDFWESPIIFDSSLPSGVLEFTTSPISENLIDYIIPLGNLGPPGHTVPTNHIYFTYPETGGNVVAPASGKVLRIEPTSEGEPDVIIYIGVSNSFTYYLDHVLLDNGISEGEWVTAGQVLGSLNPPTALDLGVLNKDVNNPFVNKSRYPEESIYGDKPLKYFTEPLRTQLYSKVSRTGEDKDGTFCYDQPGKLIGNWWFRDSPSDLLSAEGYESYAIAFVYSNYEPEKIMISFGMDFEGPEGLPVEMDAYQAEGPAPETVTPSSGKVTYKLYHYTPGWPPSIGEREGLLIVEMLDEETIKVEGFADTSSETREFDSYARVYVR